MFLATSPNPEIRSCEIATRQTSAMLKAFHRTPNVEDTKVLVIGAGQAGLAVSHELTAADVQHVVLERGRVGETWRGRWDSFCLVTPNWTIQLPGGGYAGDDPDGYLPPD